MASGPSEIQDIGKWVGSWLPVSFSLLTPPAPPDPCVGIAKTGPNDKYYTDDGLGGGTGRWSMFVCLA